jgi:hypothetical protein
MLIIKHTAETTAPVSAVWQVLQDVANWNTWDCGTEFSTLNGPFKTGTTGTLKPKGSPLLQTKLIKVEPMKMFVQEAKVTLASIVMSHFLTESGNKSTVTFQVETHGPLAFVWAFLIGRDIKKKLPIEMAAMIKIAESLR